MKGLSGRRLSVAATARTEFGPGVVAELPAFVAELGHTRAFVVTDRGLRSTGIVGRVERTLTDAGLEHVVHEDVGSNPVTTECDRGADRLRRFGAAAVVAVGGGSALDAAKAISLLAPTDGAVAAAADGRWDGADGLPLIAIPTTSGTGAETNGFGVIEDPALRRKVYVGHPSVQPRIAVLDPELTLGLPASVTAATGIDALVHGIESLASRAASPMSTAQAAGAVALVSRWLPVAYADGSDLEARSQVMLGAHLAGHALTQSGLGLVHGVGHALTVQAGIPHGIALAAVLEEVMAFAAVAAERAYEQVARSMHVTVSTGAWANAAIDAVREVSSAVEVKRPLRELGVDRAQLPAVAAGAVADPVTRNSPRPTTEVEVLDLLRSVY